MSLGKEIIMKLLSIVLVLLLLSSQIPLAFAQQSTSFSDWTAVQKIATSEKLFVRQKNGKEVRGEMIEATDSSLTIGRDGKPLSIPRNDVRQVYVAHGKAQKGKWALIGAGIGAGAGAGIGAIKYSPDRDDSAIWIPVGLMFGTGIGAASGLLFGQTTRKRTLVYAAY
jgi:hypothetical protein